MAFAKSLGIATLAVAALGLAVAAPASASPRHRHEHQVCKWERHHGKRVKTCRWVHN